MSSSKSIQVCLYNTNSNNTLNNLNLAAIAQSNSASRIVTNITRETMVNTWYFLALSYKRTTSSSGTLYFHYKSNYEQTLNVERLDNFNLNTPNSSNINIGINRTIENGNNVNISTYTQGLYKDFRVYDKYLDNTELLEISNTSHLPNINYS